MAADVTELGVRLTGEDFAAIATEELDGGGAGMVNGRSGHRFLLLFRWERDTVGL